MVPKVKYTLEGEPMRVLPDNIYQTERKIRSGMLAAIDRELEQALIDLTLLSKFPENYYVRESAERAVRRARYFVASQLKREEGN